jgi:DNA repair/transcription protein MET18/MMS19
MFVASEAAIELLSTVSSSTPRLLLEHTLPPLFALLPDQAPPRNADSERAKYWRILSFLRRICIPAELFEVLVIRLTTKLDHLSISASLVADADLEPSAAYAHSILTTLVKTLRAKSDAKHLDIPKYIHSLVSCLFRLFIHSAIFSESDRTIAADHRLVDLAAQIITLVVQNLSQE